MNLQNKAKLAFLFVVSYMATLALTLVGGQYGIRQFNLNFAQPDMMMFLLPVFGFFATYALVDWLSEYFQTNLARSPAFPIALILMSATAYYLSLYWYYANLAALSNQPEIVFNFEETFLNSHFIIALFAALLGWLSNVIMVLISNPNYESETPSSILTPPAE